MNADLRACAAAHLALRRAMGYQLTGHDGPINQFLDYLDHRPALAITVEHALAGRVYRKVFDPVAPPTGSP